MKTTRGLMLALFLCLLPSAAFAQTAGGTGTISGVVKDASGSAIAGATVTVASPALIEGNKAATTDSSGAYRIIDLRPGTYSVTFSAPGFAKLQREGLALTVGFDATENGDLKVGDVNQTVSVEATAPVVDTQNVSTDSVFNNEAVVNLPMGQSVKDYAQLIPGASNTTAGQIDVGGGKSEFSQSFAIHGGQANDFNELRDGMFFGTMMAAGNWMTAVNPSMVEETQVQLGEQTAEYFLGGAVVNVIEKEGGNQFHGEFVGNWTDHALQSGNLDPALIAGGASQTSIRRRYEAGGGVGGPIIKNKLWFYLGLRSWTTATNYSGLYFNQNDGAAFPQNLFFVPSTKPYFDDNTYKSVRLRLTYQASSKDKISVMGGNEWNCNCPGPTIAGLALEPDASIGSRYRPDYQTEVTWSHIINSHLILTAGAVLVNGKFIDYDEFESISAPVAAFNVSTGEIYGGVGYGIGPQGSEGSLRFGNTNENVGLTYVSGHHTLKTGYTYLHGWNQSSYYFKNSTDDLDYIFLGSAAAPTPLEIEKFAVPIGWNITDSYQGWYAEDQWKIKRVTISPGIRYDRMTGKSLPENIQAGAWVPARSYSQVNNIPDWNDWDPRVGVAWDLFGNGKTAVKGFVGRFADFIPPNGGITQLNAPSDLIATNATQTWKCSNPCDYNPFGPGDTLGPLSNSFFGTNNPVTTYDPSLLTGHRPYNWQESIGVEQQLWRNAAVKVNFFHRSYGNFWAVENQATTAADYTPFCVKGLANAKLPNGGGNQICGLYDVNPTSFGQVNNLVTLASKLGGGSQKDTFKGIDVNFSWHLPKGGLVLAGVATGAEDTNDCWANNLPNVLPSVGIGGALTASAVAGAAAFSPRTAGYCNINPPWSGNTQFKASVIYPLPWKFQVAMNYQNLSPVPVNANEAITSAYATTPGNSTLGRPISEGSLTIVDIPTGVYYPYKRITDLDLSFSRKFYTLRERLMIQPSVDMFNITNSNSVTNFNATVGAAYQNVYGFLDPRVVRFGVKVTF